MSAYYRTKTPDGPFGQYDVEQHRKEASDGIIAHFTVAAASLAAIPVTGGASFVVVTVPATFLGICSTIAYFSADKY